MPFPRDRRRPPRPRPAAPARKVHPCPRRCASPQSIEIPPPRASIPKLPAGLCKSPRAQRPAELGRSRSRSVAWSSWMTVSRDMCDPSAMPNPAVLPAHACQAILHPGPLPAIPPLGMDPQRQPMAAPLPGNISPKGAPHESTCQLHAREGTMAVTSLLAWSQDSRPLDSRS
ncbi:hypothetical protein B0J12DRAFT_127888 [Macrophomina phaseolina]|uniref:Uncharacterized protein n=1 Tax=Macrophomina phaseolina TaxID=35725 RepID=A0ABQ8G817_9PEZI|nr:hypothetical protein B0J12DRAFT_127888 [Macrophomina phaseolina]